MRGAKRRVHSTSRTSFVPARPPSWPIRHPSGALTFHRPVQATSRSRGGPSRVRFVVPLPRSTRPTATRGLATQRDQGVHHQGGGEGRRQASRASCCRSSWPTSKRRPGSAADFRRDGSRSRRRRWPPGSSRPDVRARPSGRCCSFTARSRTRRRRTGRSPTRASSSASAASTAIASSPSTTSRSAARPKRTRACCSRGFRTRPSRSTSSRTRAAGWCCATWSSVRRPSVRWRSASSSGARCSWRRPTKARRSRRRDGGRTRSAGWPTCSSCSPTTRSRPAPSSSPTGSSGSRATRPAICRVSTPWTATAT